ncbi:MAG: hypothetical protein ABSC01_07340, partial [Verrucomicrobiota bacterium]
MRLGFGASRIACDKNGQPHRMGQDSTVFHVGIMVIAVLAMVPVAFAPRWLPVSTLLILRG